MLRYALRRLVTSLITIFLVITLTFFLMQMVPGGPFLSEKAVSPKALAALEEKYGLDKPMGQRYLTYMKGAVHGDFGDSLKQRGRTGMSIISSKFPISARIGGLAVLLAFCIGVPLGCVSALNRGKFVDNLIIVLATCGIAVPSFVVCTLLMYTFGVRLGWLPTLGLKTWKNYIMPVMALAFYPTAYITRLMRSSMLDVLGQDYMRTARAKGLGQFVSLFKHALRNSMIPVITYLGPLTAGIVTGGFVVEQTFQIPGLGKYFISSILNRDYPIIMGTTIVLATLVIFMNLMVDIAYVFVDPRISLTKGEH